MVALAGDFVCAADEVWRLQRGSEADCVFFQRAVNGGARITDRGTRQGVWVLAPSGKLLGRDNSHSADQVLALMKRGLEAWSELPEAERALSPTADFAGVHRWEHSRPDDGLVLARIGRELTDESPQGEPARFWNRDYAWFSRAEVEALVPAQVDQESELDWSLLARRLARFHLVDNVRGQSIPYAPEELRAAHLTATAVGREGSRVRLALAGHTQAVAEGPWLLGENLWKPASEVPHGLECALAGEAVFDLAAHRFAAFELLAVGRRFGHTVNNGRWRDDTPGRIGFHLALDESPRSIAPTFVAVYDADWIVPPQVATWLASPAECGLEQP